MRSPACRWSWLTDLHSVAVYYSRQPNDLGGQCDATERIDQYHNVQKRCPRVSRMSDSLACGGKCRSPSLISIRQPSYCLAALLVRS
jgi:hypothetical protein